MTIQQLLSEPGQQDKRENLATTSLKFKEDLWNFFQGFQDKYCCEFGTHKGQTTRILSFLFDTVFTVNLPGHFDAAKELNGDRTNIVYVDVDLYSKKKLFFGEKMAAFFVDANHEYECVMKDFDRIKEMDRDDDCYIIFDDYGTDFGVKIAVADLIENGEITIVKYIGHPSGHSFGGSPERILKDWEGVICLLKK